MRPLLPALLLCAFGAAAGDDLSDAAKNAKEAREKRKSSTTRVITNADVKKSKGKLVERKNATAAPVDAPAEKSLVEQYATGYHDRAAAAEKLAAAKKKVAGLEAELAAAEQSYFEENDLDLRDGALVKQFAEIKAKLDAARAELVLLSPRAATPEP